MPRLVTSFPSSLPLASKLISTFGPWPSDGKTRRYLYENAALPNALTGITDETGTRYASFGYDSAGRAITTEHAGGTQRYQVSYPANDAASVTDPLGTVRNYSYSTTMGKLAVTKGSLPSGTGDSDAAARVQDGRGLITSETDFKGVRTDTTWDGLRRLPISVTRAAGTPEAQTVTTQWHATFSLPVLITESGRTIAFTYDSLGNLLSQSITDTATNATQRWQWSYNPQGLVATQTAPNGGITRYTYDASGQVTEALDALGFKTQYTYDSAGRIASVTAPNGLLTTYAWDARDEAHDGAQPLCGPRCHAQPGHHEVCGVHLQQAVGRDVLRCGDRLLL